MTLAHAAHWYHSLLYLLPVLLISVALWWSGRGEPSGDAEDRDADLLGPGNAEAADTPDAADGSGAADAPRPSGSGDSA